MSVTSVTEWIPSSVVSAFAGRMLRETKGHCRVLLMVKIVDVPCSVFF